MDHSTNSSNPFTLHHPSHPHSPLPYHRHFSPQFTSDSHYFAFAQRQILKSQLAAQHLSPCVTSTYSLDAPVTSSPSSATRITSKSKICGVCGDRAKSYHFGGISCDSCKAFFRRSVQNDAYKNFHCPYEGQCDINITSRKCCQYCRFKKCLSIGMEKSWVMTEEERLQMLKSRLEKRQRQPDSDQEHRASTGSTCSNECTPSSNDGSSLVALEGCFTKRLKRMRDSHKPDLGKINHFLSESEVKTIEAIVNKFILSSHKASLSCSGNSCSITPTSSSINCINSSTNGHEARVAKSSKNGVSGKSNSNSNSSMSGTSNRSNTHRESNECESNECKSGADCNQKPAPPHPHPQHPPHHPLEAASDETQNSPNSPKHLSAHGPMPSIRQILHVLFTHIQQFVTFATDLPLFSPLHHSDQQILLKDSVLMMYLLRASFDFAQDSSSSSPIVACCSSSSPSSCSFSSSSPSSLGTPPPLARPASGASASVTGSFKKVKLDASCSNNNDSECQQQQHELHIQHNKSSLTAQQICQLFGTQIYKKYISFAKSIHSLEPDEVTILLLSIVVLLNSNRKQLLEASLISQKQEQIVSVLKSYLKWRYGLEAASLIFSRLFLKLADLQELADTFHEFTFPSYIQQVEKIDSDDFMMAYTSSTKTCITANEEPMTWSLRTSLSTASTANDFETQDLDYDSSCPSDASSSSSLATSTTSTESANPISPV